MEENDELARLLMKSGAVAYGVAEACPVEDGEWSRFEAWLDAGYHAGMEYMERYPDLRRDPRLLLPGAKSLVSVAYNYRQENPIKGVATYALGQDYHKVLRRRLHSVVREMKAIAGGEWRICIDSAPVLERYWAVKTGVGTRSEVHGNIVVEGAGSMVFLAELITTRILKEKGVNFIAKSLENSPKSTPDEFQGRAVCPTGALKEGGVIDSRRCINYLTIEHRAPLTVEERNMVGEAVFGCDICQRACRENRGPSPSVLEEFKTMPGLKEFLEGHPGDFDLNSSPLKRSAIRNS